VRSQKDLSQTDLSKLSDEDMSAAERAEIKRRFELFIETMRGGRKVGKGTKPAKKVRKWLPSKPGQTQIPSQNSTTTAADRAVNWRPTGKRH
jgi:hypothetical protein